MRFLSIVFLLTIWATLSIAEDLPVSAASPTEEVLKNPSEQIVEQVLILSASATPVVSESSKQTENTIEVVQTGNSSREVDVNKLNAPASNKNQVSNVEILASHPFMLLGGFYVLLIIITYWIGKMVDKSVAKKSIKVAPENTVRFVDYARYPQFLGTLVAPIQYVIVAAFCFAFWHSIFDGMVGFLIGAISFIVVQLFFLYTDRVIDRGIAYDPESQIIELPLWLKRVKVPVDQIRGVQLNGKTQTARSITSDSNKINVEDNVTHTATLIILTNGKPIKLKFRSNSYGDNWLALGNACVALISRAANLEPS